MKLTSNYHGISLLLTSKLYPVCFSQGIKAGIPAVSTDGVPLQELSVLLVETMNHHVLHVFIQPISVNQTASVV
jgi:hypothetical protein